MKYDISDFISPSSYQHSDTFCILISDPTHILLFLLSTLYKDCRRTSSSDAGCKVLQFALLQFWEICFILFVLWLSGLLSLDCVLYFGLFFNWGLSYMTCIVLLFISCLERVCSLHLHQPFRPALQILSY